MGKDTCPSLATPPRETPWGCGKENHGQEEEEGTGRKGRRADLGAPEGERLEWEVWVKITAANSDYT